MAYASTRHVPLRPPTPTKTWIRWNVFERAPLRAERSRDSALAVQIPEITRCNQLDRIPGTAWEFAKPKKTDRAGPRSVYGLRHRALG